jgi:hypothetical protein
MRSILRTRRSGKLPGTAALCHSLRLEVSHRRPNRLAHERVDIDLRTFIGDPLAQPCSRVGFGSDVLLAIGPCVRRRPSSARCVQPVIWTDCLVSRWPVPAGGMGRAAGTGEKIMFQRAEAYLDDIPDGRWH